MRSNMAAITSPLLSRMITPTRIELELLNTAPLKFALKELVFGGVHDYVDDAVELLGVWVSCELR